MIAVLGVHAGRVPAGTEELLAGAELVAGGVEALDALAPPGARRLTLGADLEPALAELARGARPSACVLASGDPGFFGIVRALGERVGRRAAARCTRRRRRWRSRSVDWACRGTTR